MRANSSTNTRDSEIYRRPSSNFHTSISHVESNPAYYQPPSIVSASAYGSDTLGGLVRLEDYTPLWRVTLPVSSSSDSHCPAPSSAPKVLGPSPPKERACIQVSRVDFGYPMAAFHLDLVSRVASSTTAKKAEVKKHGIMFLEI